MKIICAGLSKTGTKSINAALTRLGYNVCGYFKHLEYHMDEWQMLARNEADATELLRKMFANDDAVCGFPAYCFWEELLGAFPEAKVILMIRDSEEQYYHSRKKQLLRMDSGSTSLTRLVSPTYKRFMIWNLDCLQHAIPRSARSPSSFGKVVSEIIDRQAYRRHNAYVMQRCPKDKLLVFNCKEGWDPLCQFLGLPIPDEPFPRKNVDGAFAGDLMKTNLFKRIRRETTAIISLTSLIVCIASYACIRIGSDYML